MLFHGWLRYVIVDTVFANARVGLYYYMAINHTADSLWHKMICITVKKNFFYTSEGGSREHGANSKRHPWVF